MGLLSEGPVIPESNTETQTHTHDPQMKLTNASCSKNMSFGAVQELLCWQTRRKKKPSNDQQIKRQKIKC